MKILNNKARLSNEKYLTVYSLVIVLYIKDVVNMRVGHIKEMS